MNELAPLTYRDDAIRAILQRVKVIAMVGASTNWNRPSYFVMKYLQSKGYRVIPVNPGAAGQTLLGETVYKSLRDIPVPVDMVDVFRKEQDIPPIAQSAVAIGARCLWQQLGLKSEEADRIATAAGLDSIWDRCVKIEHARLFGGLNWAGVNTQVISAKRPIV